MIRNNSFLDDFKHAFQRRGNGLQQIILINVIVFVISGLLWLFSPQQLHGYFQRFMAMPSDAEEFIWKPWTLITHFFTHYDFMHIFWNMIGLYWFGRLIKEYLGSDKLIALFILGGLSGGLSILFFYNVIPGLNDNIGTSAIGASAGVFAVVVGAATLLPNHSFNLLFIGEVKIKYIAAAQVFLSLIAIRGANMGGEIAHLTGTLMGFMYIKQLQKGNDIGQWITDTLLFIKGIFSNQPLMKVNYPSSEKKSKKGKKAYQSTSHTPAEPRDSVPGQDEIDTILDKISQSGYESLSKEEKQKLFNASKN